MTGSVRGVVLRGTGGVWHVHAEGGETREVTLRGRLKREEPHGDAIKLAVGDEVRIEPEPRGAGWVITEILPRRSQLARRAPGGGYGERVIAANLDQIVVVLAAAEPDPHPRLLDRFLVVAAANDLPARIVINKIDLVGEAPAGARFADYGRAGYPVQLTSIRKNVGLDALRGALTPRPGGRCVSALTGPSGVGKSSLLNALFPGLGLRVGEISRSVMKGRHTTVGADMHPLADGAYVVDTPGLREVGVWGLPPDALDRCFLEFRPYLGHCRFDNCAHRSEPGCAVREAVEQGAVSIARYDSYLHLREELEGVLRVQRGW